MAPEVLETITGALLRKQINYEYTTEQKIPGRDFAACFPVSASIFKASFNQL
jgi:hypothetical protein